MNFEELEKDREKERAEKTRAWLDRHRDEHRGYWLGLDGDRLLVKGDSLTEVLAELKKLKLKRAPYVTKIMGLGFGDLRLK